MNNGQPLVSVIIPVHNREKFIQDALKSVFKQDYEALEVIVVDDGSTDRTAEVVRSFKKVRYFYQAHQGIGPAQARNLGLRESKGEFISFLDSDDMWLPQKTRLQVNYLLANPDKGLVLCHIKNFIETGSDIPSWLDEKTKRNMADINAASFIPSALMSRRSVFEKIGDFNISFKMGDDTDWFLRAREASVPMAILPDKLTLRRIHDSNLSHLMNDSRWTVQNVLKIVKASIDRKKSKEL